MKKSLVTLLALVLTFSMVACGKANDKQQDVAGNIASNAETVNGIDSITFNGTTLTFPCKVQDVVSALDGVNTVESGLSTMLEPSQTEFCNIFDHNNTSFGFMNLSDSTATVKDSHVILVSTTVSLSEQTFNVVYPAGIEYGKAFDKEKAYEILGEPVYNNTSDAGENFRFEKTIENVGSYDLTVLVGTDGNVLGATLMVHPDTTKETAENVEPEETTPVETVPVEDTIAAEENENVYDFSIRLQDIVYDESGLEKSDEILGMDKEAKFVEMKTKGVVINMPCNVQDFININSAIEWDVDVETLQPGESTSMTFPGRSLELYLVVNNPTDKELNVKDCMIKDFSINSSREKFNESASFDLEFPGGVKLGREFDAEILSQYDGYMSIETSTDIEYRWFGDGVSYQVKIDKETNLVVKVYIGYFNTDLTYAEPTITEATPYSSTAENMNVMGVDLQELADGTNEVLTYSVGANEMQLPCTLQEVLDQTGLILGAYDSFELDKGKYIANIPLYDENGVKCLVLKIYNGDEGMGRRLQNCTVYEVAQPVNDLVPEQYKLKEE